MDSQRRALPEHSRQYTRGKSTARNTRENIERSCELLDACAFGGQRCVVTSDYHLLRALFEAQQVGVALVPIAAPTPPGTALQQWCREVLTILAGR